MPKDERLYVKIALDFIDHYKVLPLSDAAFRCLVEAIIWSAKAKLDGLLPRSLSLVKWDAEVLAELCSNDPENPTLLEVEQGWLIRDFGEHQLTNADIEHKREVRRIAGQKGGRASAASKSQAKSSKPQAKGEAKLKQNQPRIENRELEITTPPTPKGVVPPHKPRATRLPENWMPDPEVIAAMKSEIAKACRVVDFPAEHRKFVDHWLAQPGSKGTKLDWNATWRNWIRKSVEFNSNGNGHVNGNGHKPNKLRVAVELAAKLRAEEQAQQQPTQGELE